MAKQPRIVDGAAAKMWLANLRQPGSLAGLVEIAQVLRTLGASGVGDGAAIIHPQRRFAIAERVRAVLLPILQERGSDGQLAVLPLDDDFARHCWAAIEAAAALRDAYAWLASQLSDAPLPADASLSGATVTGAAQPVATITGVSALHRALDVDAQLLMCIQRARWPVPDPLWERHCVLGQLVRDLDCQDVEVADALHASVTKTCRAAFVAPILTALADPAARTSIEFQVIRMAAQRWATKVGFRLERRADGAVAPARPVVNPGPTVQLGHFLLRLDTQSATQSIDRRLEALADGRTPREAGIGDSLRPQAARDLLIQLRQRWGAVSPADVASPDRAWRVSAGGQPVLAVVGMPQGPTRSRDGEAPPNGRGPSPYAYQRGQHGAITRPRAVVESDRVARMLVDAETWVLAAESPDAVRCVRRYARPRLGLQRLIGLKLGAADAASPFLLGWVEALQGAVGQGPEGQLQQTGAQTIRVRFAPGVPQVIQAAVDDTDLDCAFLLVPGVAATVAGQPPRPAPFVPMLSDAGAGVTWTDDQDGWEAVRAAPRDHGLVLPHATFRPQRLVKAGRNGVVATLRLEELMMRGSDFDLVRFSVS